ncbi:MAG: prolyl oligopeptidase family serine peptidase [Muribaculaceae bacterium]|nr:prolyl oligopeptidase family serine peptidase [Muribaculaceae bacterium]
MINKLTAAMTASAIALSFFTMRGDDASVRFDAYKVSPSVGLRLPVIPADSVFSSKNAFSNDMLLSVANRKLEKPGADWMDAAADTAFSVAFPKAVGDPVLRTLATRLRPSRYVSGKLRLKSNVMAQLYNGSSSLLKVTSADSVGSWKDVDIELEPAETADLFVTFISFPEDPADPAIALEFVPDAEFGDVEFSHGPSIKKRFRIDESALGERVRSVSVSPDGRFMVVRYYNMYGEGKYKSWAVLQECASGKTVSVNIPMNSFWMDKGSRLCYTESTDDTYSLYSLDASTMRQTLLAKDLPESSFFMSPDESFLIFHKYVEGTKDSGPLLRLRNPDDRLRGHRDRYYLERYDLKTGIRQPLTYAGNSTTVYDVSPDSRKLIYGSVTEKMDVFPFYFQDIMQLDLQTLAVDTLVKADPYLRSVTYSPDGKRLFITGGPESLNGVGKNNGGHKYSNDYDVQGFILDIADKSVRPMTRDFNPSIEGEPVWNRADGQVYFRASDGFDLNVYSMNPNSGKISKFDFGMPYINGFSIGLDESRWIAAVGSDYHYAGRAEMLDAKNGKLRIIDDPYTAEFPDLQPGEASSWTFKASDGTTIDCMQVLPPDFDPKKKYPMIVYYYGGCSPSQRYVSVYDPQIFASRGYVTLVMNPSGAYGYGQEFSARHANAWGKRTAEDIIEGVKEYCRTHDFVDDKKIGCLGASYGGFMTQYLQTLTDIFAAAVSHAGISDVTSYWGEGNWGYSYNTTAAPESYPWNNPDLFTKQGSLFNADKIHTPILLLHGNADTNVPIGESIQLFNALRILGRDVEFIQVDGENHYISDYDKRQPWHAAIMAWFAKYLQDAPQWWDSMYPDN